MTLERLSCWRELIPVPSHGSTYVLYMIPPQNVMPARVTPVVAPGRQFHSGTKSRNGIMYTRILGDQGAVSRVGRKGKTKVFKYGRKSPWVPILTELFPQIALESIAKSAFCIMGYWLRAHGLDEQLNIIAVAIAKCQRPNILPIYARCSICIGNSMICSDIWLKYHINISKLLYVISRAVRQFWNITSVIYAKCTPARGL